METELLLELKALRASYDHSEVLFGVDLAISAGEVVALLGRNGMGKTTSIHCITGIKKSSGGTIIFKEKAIDPLPSHKIAHLGIGLVPEGRRIFGNLSVRENLIMAGIEREGAGGYWDLDRVLSFFPRLRERSTNGGNQLSGGEQQMLAIGRALMTNPQLLILDEATEGLAPLIRKEIWARLNELKEQGLAMLVVDKEVQTLANFADRHYIMERGRIAWSGTSTELTADGSLAEKYLTV